MEIINRYARFQYHILETFEAGIALKGSEVKAIKKGQMQLKGSYIRHRNGELWLINAHIAKYQPSNQHVFFEPSRSRKLLLNRAEIDRLRGRLETPGLTIIPLKVYTKKALLKVEIAVVRGKKHFDKRSTLRERDEKKRMRSLLRSAPK